MPKRMLAALALILAMTAAAEAQFTTLQGWIIVPGKEHADNFEVRITLREGYEPYASTTVSDTGRYMFTNLDFSVGSFDVLINLEGYREFRTPIERFFEPGLMNRSNLRGNIILIPDFESRRQTENRDAYNKALLDEYAMGLDAITNKHPELAVAHLEKVANEVPDFYDAHINLGLVYQDLFRWRAAEKEFRIAHELNGESARPLMALGRLLVDEVENEYQAGSKLDVVQPKLTAAREVLTEAVMLDPKLAIGFYYLGAIAFRSSAYPDAERESKRALELDRTLSLARITLINVFEKQKMWQAALDNVDLFILEYPLSPYREEVKDRRLRIVAQLEKK